MEIENNCISKLNELLIYQIEDQHLEFKTKLHFKYSILDIKQICKPNRFLIALSEQLIIIDINTNLQRKLQVTQIYQKKINSVITNLQVSDNLILIGDYFKGVIQFQYDETKNDIKPVCYSNEKEHILQSLFYGSKKHVMTSDQYGNIMIYGKKQEINSDNDILKLNKEIEFRFMEVVSRIIEISNKSVIYGSVYGSIGFISQIDQQIFDRLYSIQNKLIDHYKQLNYPEIKFHDVISGDLLKTIKTVNIQDQKNIIGEFGLSELLLLLDQFEKEVFQ